MAGVNKAVSAVATIDVDMVTIKGAGVNADTYLVKTGSKVMVEPEIFEDDAKKLIINGAIYAQKPAKKTVTGAKITLTDNTFSVELVKIVQGGTITMQVAPNETKVASYAPPVNGSADTGEVFELTVYSAIYDRTGALVNYEKITYYNCRGNPIALSTEDGNFRSNEYVINSTLSSEGAPYLIEYVSALPVAAA